MKHIQGIIYTLAMSLLFLPCIVTSSSGDDLNTADPFSHEGTERNMIVVFSDIHLGADLSYAECNENVDTLAQFLNQVRNSTNVKELVIAGDLIDEWFIPADISTYKGKDQADFVERVKTANEPVFTVLNQIIAEGKITVTYVPGNHDLTITAENIERVLPGIQQARDAEKLGLGTYSPAGHPEIAIEHSNRYNLFCAPDPISNQDIASGTIMPPGYFFTRIAALWVHQGKPQLQAGKIPVVTPNKSATATQNGAFAYWQLWQGLLQYFAITNSFDEKIILTDVDHFTGSFSVNDLLPYQLTDSGEIDMRLFKGIQDSWEERQTHNNVAVHTSFEEAAASANSNDSTDRMAQIQYFENPSSDKRIVVFGHTHVERLITGKNTAGEKTIYANAGAWIDENLSSPTNMNFVVITPPSVEGTKMTGVKTYSYTGGSATLIHADSLQVNDISDEKTGFVQDSDTTEVTPSSQTTVVNAEEPGLNQDTTARAVTPSLQNGKPKKSKGTFVFAPYVQYTDFDNMKMTDHSSTLHQPWGDFPTVYTDEDMAIYNELFDTYFKSSVAAVKVGYERDKWPLLSVMAGIDHIYFNSWEDTEQNVVHSTDGPALTLGMMINYDKLFLKRALVISRAVYNFTRSATIETKTGTDTRIGSDYLQAISWEADIGLGVQLGRVVPYAGVGFTQLFMKTHHETFIEGEDEDSTGATVTIQSSIEEESSYRGDAFFGFAGVDILMSDYVSMYCRGSFTNPVRLVVGFRTEVKGGSK